MRFPHGGRTCLRCAAALKHSNVRGFALQLDAGKPARHKGQGRSERRHICSELTKGQQPLHCLLSQPFARPWGTLTAHGLRCGVGRTLFPSCAAPAGRCRSSAAGCRHTAATHQWSGGPGPVQIRPGWRWPRSDSAPHRPGSTGKSPPR